MVAQSLQLLSGAMWPLKGTWLGMRPRYWQFSYST